jgi:hypothetical protein
MGKRAYKFESEINKGIVNFNGSEKIEQCPRSEET